MTRDASRETWRPIRGYEGIYEVSDQGRVRSVDRTIVFEHPTHGTIRKRLRSRVLRPNRPATSGRSRVSLCREGHDAPHVVARLVLEGFVGPCPDGHQAKSLNDDPDDCRLANLAWRSLPDIRHHAVASGAQPIGDRHYMAKLTLADVSAIRAATSETGRDLAEHYDVSPKTISAIRRGKTWKGVGVALGERA